jgi:hypothetical protein
MVILTQSLTGYVLARDLEEELTDTEAMMTFIRTLGRDNLEPLVPREGPHRQMN